MKRKFTSAEIFLLFICLPLLLAVMATTVIILVVLAINAF